MFPIMLSHVIFALSFAILGTAIYAFKKKRYDIAIIAFAAFLTSITHWSDPKFGIVRELDLFVIRSGYVYIFIRAIMLKIQSILFWICFISMGAFYILSHFLYNNGDKFGSFLTHCGVHIFGNAAVLLFCE